MPSAPAPRVTSGVRRTVTPATAAASASDWPPFTAASSFAAACSCACRCAVARPVRRDLLLHRVERLHRRRRHVLDAERVIGRTAGRWRLHLDQPRRIALLRLERRLDQRGLQFGRARDRRRRAIRRCCPRRPACRRRRPARDRSASRPGRRRCRARCPPCWPGRTSGRPPWRPAPRSRSSSFTSSKPRLAARRRPW